MADSPIREKSFEFALKVIRIANRLRQYREYVISDQLVRAGTSIGSNVEELIRILTAIVKTAGRSK